jgi:hypothetical protein
MVARVRGGAVVILRFLLSRPAMDAGGGRSRGVAAPSSTLPPAGAVPGACVDFLFFSSGSKVEAAVAQAALCAASDVYRELLSGGYRGFSASLQTLRLEVNRSRLHRLFRRGVSPAALAQVASSPALVRQPSSEACQSLGEGGGSDRVLEKKQDLQCLFSGPVCNFLYLLVPTCICSPRAINRRSQFRCFAPVPVQKKSEGTRA